MSNDLRTAQNKRTGLKSALTRQKTFAASPQAKQATGHEILERKRKLDELFKEFDAVQTTIELLELAEVGEDDQELLQDRQLAQRDEFEANFFSIAGIFNALLQPGIVLPNNPVAPNGGVHQQGPNPNNGDASFRLPKIELPVFAGAYDEWFSFKDTFVSLIHQNERIPVIQKFHYLRASLKEKAADVIRSFDITEANYAEAWAMLESRFNNVRWIVQGHIRAIFELPTVHKENHIALRTLGDGALKQLRALHALKRPTESWDDLIIHILVSKLDMTTAKEWETSLPDRTMPTLLKLTDLLQQRCLALEALTCINNRPVQKTQTKVTSPYTATSTVKCTSCKAAHHLSNCESFRAQSVDQRFQFVRKANICKNCLLTTKHQAPNCTKGSCRRCHKKHNTLLHFATQGDTLGPKNISTNSVSKTTAEPSLAPQA